MSRIEQYEDSINFNEDYTKQELSHSSMSSNKQNLKQQKILTMSFLNNNIPHNSSNTEKFQRKNFCNSQNISYQDLGLKGFLTCDNSNSANNRNFICDSLESQDLFGNSRVVGDNYRKKKQSEFSTSSEVSQNSYKSHINSTENYNCNNNIMFRNKQNCHATSLISQFACGNNQGNSNNTSRMHNNANDFSHKQKDFYSINPECEGLYGSVNRKEQNKQQDFKSYHYNNFQSSSILFAEEKHDLRNSDFSRRVGKWSEEEDKILTELVEKFGGKNWKKISQFIPGRNSIQCLHRWTKILQPGLIKGPWTIEEDRRLLEWVRKQGPTKWTNCAHYIKGRNGKQCRERWFHTLNPKIVKGNWTCEEDFKIFILYKIFGGKWAKISAFMTGRTENAIKNRFYSTLRRKAAEKLKNPSSASDKQPNKGIYQYIFN